MAESQYAVLEGLPTPQTYHDIRKLAGMTPPPMEAVPKSLANSFCCIVGYERKYMLDDTTPGPAQDVIAMGRLVGDGSLFLILVDVAVHPDHQRRGLGKRIVQKLVDYVDEHAPPLYGFKDVTPGVGMYRMIRGPKDQQDITEDTEKGA